MKLFFRPQVVHQKPRLLGNIFSHNLDLNPVAYYVDFLVSLGVSTRHQGLEGNQAQVLRS